MGETGRSPLYQKRVLITRAKEQSESLIRGLTEFGAVPVCLPVVAFEPPDDLSPLDEAIRDARSFDWILLTSQNAVRALEERCEALGLTLAKATEGVRIAAVGPATAESAKSCGLKVAYVASKHQGVSLAEELTQELKGERVLLPRSDRANPELVDVLNRIGAQVTEIVAYKTVRPTESDSAKYEPLLNEGVDAILFFSPSAVHHLQDMVGNEKFRELSHQAAFAAIGPVTGEALHKAQVSRVVMAQDTTVTGILDALTEFFSRPDTGLPAGVKRG